jgi:hypothetical protein
MPGRPVRGFRQGSLDGLCGFYAIVNAVKTAARNRGRPHVEGVSSAWFRREEAFELFGVLARHLERDRRLARSYGEGIEAVTLVRLLRQANRWLERNLGLRLVARRAFFRPARPRRTRVVAVIERHLTRPNTAALIGLHGHPGHWTVASAVSREVFRLADSDGGCWLRKRPLAGRNRAGFHAGRIDPYTLFLIEVRPSRRSRSTPSLTLTATLSSTIR